MSRYTGRSVRIWTRCASSRSSAVLRVSTPEDVARFLTACLERYAASTAATHYRGLKQFYRWAVGAGVVEASPMSSLRKPRVQDPPVPIVTRGLSERSQHLSAGHLQRDQGRRHPEPVPLHRRPSLGDSRPQARAPGRGHGVRPREGWTLPNTPGVPRHRSCDGALPRGANALPLPLPPLGVVVQGGAFHAFGIRRMMRSRCDRAGVARFHPHQLRHTFAHNWLSLGGSEGDLMTLAGWSSRQILRRYRAAMRSERALEAHRRLYA